MTGCFGSAICLWKNFVNYVLQDDIHQKVKGLQTSIIIFEHPRALESTHEFSKHHHKTFQHKFYFIFSNRFYGFTPNDVYILIKVKCNTHFPGENKVTSSMVLIVKGIYSSDYKIEYFNSFAICCELRISVLLSQ